MEFLATYQSITILCAIKSQGTARLVSNHCPDIRMHFANGFNEAVCLIKKHPIDVIVFDCDDCESFWLELTGFKSQYPHFPFVALADKKDVHWAQKLGQIGIEEILALDEMHNLLKVIQNFKQQIVQAIQQELGVDEKNLSADSKRCLEILLNHYLEIKDVGDFTKRAGISRFKLIYKLRKEISFKPKNLLLALKIWHALHLMQNPGLTLGDISRIIGCSNEKGFNKLSNRLFGMPPKTVREEILLGNQEKFLQKLKNL